MASRFLDTVREKGEYAIGALNSRWAKPLANGAVAGEKMENYILVETYYENGVRKCKPLSDVSKSKDVYLLCAVERRMPNEDLRDFYIGKGEQVKLVILQEGLRYDASKCEKNEGVESIKEGFVAHFDPTKKAFMISNPKTPHVDYEKSAIKLTVVKVDTELGYNQEMTTNRFEISEINRNKTI